MVKLALSYVVEYAGNVDKPRHELVLHNDLSTARRSLPHSSLLPGSNGHAGTAVCDFDADGMLEASRIAIRNITRKFALHFDTSLTQLPHPTPEVHPSSPRRHLVPRVTERRMQVGELQATRFVMGKGRAQVYIDTFFKYNRSLRVPSA